MLEIRSVRRSNEKWEFFNFCRHRSHFTRSAGHPLLFHCDNSGADWAGVIIYDFYGGSEQLPAGGETIRGSSVQWSRLYINGAAASESGAVLNVSTVGILGTNVSDAEVKLDEAYFLCGIDERRLNAQIGRGGARYKIRDVGPLPPGALFFVVSDPLGPVDAGLNPNEFLKTCATVSLVVKYNGTTQQIDFDRRMVESVLPKP
jgi:hypothetical protein